MDIMVGVKGILLSNGFLTFVDEADYDRVKLFTWYFHRATGYVMGYITKGRGRKPVYLHRFILDAGPDDYTDHKDVDSKLDNRRSNIRLCTQGENNLNADSDRGTTSNYRGVSYDRTRSRWVTQYRCRFIGYFEDEIVAAIAYDTVAKQDAPAFVRLNFPGDKP